MQFWELSGFHNLHDAIGAIHLDEVEGFLDFKLLRGDVARQLFAE